MKLLLLRWTMGVWLALVGTVGLGELRPAQAALALSFDLPESALAQADPAPPPAPPPAPDPVAEADPNPPQPLPIPPQATRPPMRHHAQLPSGVLTQRGELAALEQGHSPAALLPPAPPWVDPVPAIAVAEVVPPEPEPELEPEPEPIVEIALRFDLDSNPLAAPAIAQTTEPPAAQPPLPADWLPWLFEGDSQSLVARAVGMAEGTRTVDGGITSAYHGHTDPGNRAWNLGTFSYQHGASSVEEADRKQLQRLQQQTDVLRRRALRHGLTLTLEETLNGIDLANQSPLAAIGPVGYIERLAEVKHHWGLSGTEAIVVARTRSYINPRTGRWNAPGLGNTEASITRDQRRRADAVARALAAYPKPWPDLQATTPILGADAQIPVAVAVPEPEPRPPIAVAFWPPEKAESNPAPNAPNSVEEGAIAAAPPEAASVSQRSGSNAPPTAGATAAVPAAAESQIEPAPMLAIPENEPAAPEAAAALVETPGAASASPSESSPDEAPIAAPNSEPQNTAVDPPTADLGTVDSPETIAPPSSPEISPEIVETASAATVRPTRSAPVEQIFSGQAAVDDLELVPGATPDVQVYFPWTRDRLPHKPGLSKSSETAPSPTPSANPTAQADRSQ